MRRAAMMLTLALLARPAGAALTPAELAVLDIAPPPGASLPAALPLVDEAGRAVTPLALRTGRPALLVLADFTCTTLCGTALGMAAASLEASRLSPGIDYDLLVLGIDPRDGPVEAAALKQARLGGSALAAHARFLSGDAGTLRAAQDALGYTARLDTEADQYAHPLGALVLTADGRVSSVLSGLALEPEALRVAIAGAAGGRLGAVAERLRLLCYGLDPASGVRNAMVKQALSLGTAATLLALGFFILALNRRRRRG